MPCLCLARSFPFSVLAAYQPSYHNGLSSKKEAKKPKSGFLLLCISGQISENIVCLLTKLFKLGKSKTITKYICLSFISFLPLFHFCCIYYFGSLIFCCQFVARFIITGRKTFDKYCLFYILASLYALSSSLSLNILYIHSGIA